MKKNIFKVFLIPFKIIFGVIKTFTLTLLEIKEAKRIESKLIVDCDYADDNGIIRNLKGRLDKKEEFIYLENQNKIFFRGKDTRYFNEKLQPKFYLSANNQTALNLADLTKAKTLKIANSKDVKIKFRGKNPKVWKELMVDKYPKIYPCIDLKEFDKWDCEDNTGYNFTIDAYRIAETKTLEFLEPIAKRTILITLLFGLCLGMITMAIILWSIQMLL